MNERMEATAMLRVMNGSRVKGHPYFDTCPEVTILYVKSTWTKIEHIDWTPLHARPDSAIILDVEGRGSHAANMVFAAEIARHVRDKWPGRRLAVYNGPIPRFAVHYDVDQWRRDCDCGFAILGSLVDAQVIPAYGNYHLDTQQGKANWERCRDMEAGALRERDGSMPLWYLWHGHPHESVAVDRSRPGRWTRDVTHWMLEVLERYAPAESTLRDDWVIGWGNCWSQVQQRVPEYPFVEDCEDWPHGIDWTAQSLSEHDCRLAGNDVEMFKAEASNVAGERRHAEQEG